MELQQLKGFLAVAKHKNFTVAARKTFRSQPTISLQVKALEEELGVKLFERIGHRKVILTHDGEILYELVLPLVTGLENLPDRFNEARGVPGVQDVCVVTHDSVMRYFLPEIIKNFREKFPDCHLTILNRNRQEITSMLSDGEADIGLTSLNHIPKHLDYKLFARFERILITAKDHPLSRAKSLTMRDITRYPLLLQARSSKTRNAVEELFKQRGLDYTVTMDVVGRDVIKTYVGMNLGISIINEYTLDETDHGNLFTKNLTKYFGPAESAIVTRKHRHLSEPARELIRLILEAGQQRGKSVRPPKQ